MQVNILIVVQVYACVLTSVVQNENTSLSSKLKNNDEHTRSIKKILYGMPGHGYYMEIGLGVPSQKVKLLLDTGSSDLAVAARDLPHVSTSFIGRLSKTIHCSRHVQHVRYQLGSWFGQVCTDQLTLVGGANNTTGVTKHTVTPVNVRLALITSEKSFFLPDQSSSWQGIVGLAFDRLTVQPTTLVSKTSSRLVKIFENIWRHLIDPISASVTRMPGYTFLTALVNQYHLRDSFSLLLCGLTKSSSRALTNQSMTGLIDFGGEHAVHSLKHQLTSNSNGRTLYTPVRTDWYYEVVLIDIRLQNYSMLTEGHCKELNFDKAIIDSGTTNIHVPQRVFNRIVEHLQRHMVTVAMDNPILSPLAATEATVVRLQSGSGTFWSGKSMICEPIASVATSQVGGVAGLPYSLFPPIEIHLVAYTPNNSSSGNSRQILALQLSPQQYIRYMGRRVHAGFVQDCFIFGIQPSRHIGTILGAVFMEGFSVLFNRQDMKIGFSNSSCNKYNVNITGLPDSAVLGLKPWSTRQGVTASPMEYCAFRRPQTYLTQQQLSHTAFIFFISNVIIIFAMAIPLVLLCCKSEQSA